MWRNRLCAASGVVAVLFGASSAGASTLVPKLSNDAPTVLQRVHSVYEAEETLNRRGFYDIRLERANLPYSFNACKRGVRYHIHVNYYGDLVQVDPLGRCDGDGYDRRRDYDYGYDRRRGYDRYRYREGY
jgi:hypothetical protein